MLDTMRLVGEQGGRYLEALSRGIGGDLPDVPGKLDVDLVAALREANPWYDRLAEALQKAREFF